MVPPVINSLEHVLILEICSGSAKFSHCCNEAGLHAIPIDHSRNTHNTWHPTVTLDVSDTDQCSILLETIESGQVQVVLAALPCGTCSKAREIPLSKYHHGPRPLRSSAFPRGLPNLEGVDAVKVQKANSIYDNVYTLILAALAMDVKVIIENPKNSYLWEIDQFSSLLDMGFVDVVFQHCKWSPGEESRPKWTKLRTNMLELLRLDGPCSLDHKHIGWGITQSGQFATAMESEYPIGMCKAMVSCITSFLSKQGFVVAVPNTLLSTSDMKGYKKRKLSTLNQPRGRRVPDVVSEFKQIIKLEHGATLSEFHKLLRHDVEEGEPNDEGTNTSSVIPVVGVFRSPEEFVEVALKAQHPADSQFVLPDSTCQALSELLTSPPEDIIKKQLHALRDLAKLVQDTAGEHETRSSSWDSDTRKLMLGKNLLAFESLLRKYPDEFKDLSLVSEMFSGFSLVGLEEYKQAFEYEPIMPKSTTSQLQSTSVMNNQSLLKRTKTSGNPETDDKLWSLVLEERDNGWLVGPFYSVDELLPHTGGVRPHISRRFPLEQGSKLRPIDDYAESSINLCHGRFDKLWLMDVDYVAAVIRTYEMAIFGETSSLVSSTGKIYDVSQIKDRANVKFLGKTIDLKSAYKQLFVKPEHRWTSCISVYDPHKSTAALFCQITLPFGAAASVLHFNRVSRAIWLLGTKELLLTWLNFYDDFPIVYPKALTKSCEHAVSLFFKLLGWAISNDPKKTAPFSEHFTALGVSFFVGCLSTSLSTVSNLESRINNVGIMLKSIIETKHLSNKQAEVLRGKLQYMDCQVFGRLGKSLIKPLYDQSMVSDTLDEWSLTVLRELDQWLKTSKPRIISPPPFGPTYLLFTDGASEFVGEELKQSIGSILFVQNSKWSRVISADVPEKELSSWQAMEQFSKLRSNCTKDKRQFITEAELYAVLVGLFTWKEILFNNRLIVFVDSDPAKFSLIRGTSNSLACADIVKRTHMLLSDWHIHVWVTRVPTKSNPADAPSRGKPQEAVEAFGSELVVCQWP